MHGTYLLASFYAELHKDLIRNERVTCSIHVGGLLNLISVVLMNRLALVVFFWALLTFNVEAQESTQQRIKIGAVLPLTGDMAIIGTAIRQGIELCTSKTQHVGISVKVEDDKTLNRLEAVRAVRKFVGIDHVSVVFDAYVNTVSAIEPITRQAGVPCLVIWDSNRTLRKFNSHVVGFGYSTELAGEDMAQFATAKLGRKSVAILGFEDEWSEVISSAFSDRFVASSGKVVMHERVSADTTDFKALIAKAKSAGADVLYLPLFGAGLQSAIRQARSMQFKGEILTGDSFGEVEIKQLGVSADGIYVSQIWFENSAFSREYSEKFGTAESNGTNLGYAALGCDAVKMIDELSGAILSRGIELSSVSLKEGFKGFSFEGVLGKTEIGADNTTNRREAILQVRDGKFILIESH